jgi:hypothetical protein
VTVKELIEALEEFFPGSQVTIECIDGDERWGQFPFMIEEGNEGVVVISPVFDAE